MSPETLYGWLETILWCWISCLKLKRCRIITLTYALNEVVTILEVWVQKTATLVQNEQLKFLSPFPYEVQIQRFNYLGVVFHFAFFLFSFFDWAIFFKFPVVKPLDKYCTSNSWFFSDILGVMHYFFKPWKGDKLQAWSQISTSISSV